MPVNAPNEYYIAEEKYRNAKTREEKIRYLEEMIALLPKHHGSEKLLMELKKRLAKIKSQKESKTAKSGFSLKKEGAAQVCLIGLANSGKSTLLKLLTGVDVKIDEYPYTTTKPEVGMMKYEDVWIQIVEIPSTFEPAWMGIAKHCDLIIKVIDGQRDLHEQRKEIRRILEEHRIKVPSIKIITKRPLDIEKIKKDIWNNLGIIRIYTKSKEVEEKPIIFKGKVTVKDVAKEVHKDFLKHFRYARVWGKSVKFQGAQVGLEHELADKDIVQIFA
ncbi:MAG: TGS domain-containing protein [Candidatus Aenigmarchaeota archaeon]|nr:TGS domain-containing protein [Candidatus Aenigmarchaeota archaeon]MCX8179368.1 TGS domain-containing protein [Candidatus Aenigmarchaeota archaeon]